MSIFIFKSRTFICAGFLFFALFACENNTADKSSNAENTSKTDTALVNIEAVNQKIKEDPANASLYLLRSQLYFKQFSFEEALNDVNRALSIDSSRADIFLQRADIYYRNQQTRLAKQDLEKALKLDPKYIPAYLKLSEIALLLKDYKESIKNANEALKIDVFNPVAYFMKGMSYKYGKDTAMAISSFQTAVEQDNQYYNAYVELGALFASKHNPLAIDYFNNAINLRPASIEAIYHKCCFLQTHGNSLKAEEGYQLIFSLDSINKITSGKNTYPLTHEFWYNAGLCYENLKNKKQAQKMYQKSLELKEDFELAARALSRVEN